MVSKVNGIVIKETDTGESGKRIIILTKEHGKMLLFARGAKNTKSKTMAGTQLFSYSEFTVFEGKGFYSVTQADIIESFYDIRNDIDKLAYGAYVLELTERISFEELEDLGIFELLFRTLLAMCKNKIEPKLVTAIFIIRLIKESGFTGLFCECSECGKDLKGEVFLEMHGGRLVCDECEKGEQIFIKAGTMKAINYISECRMKDLYKFNVSKEVMEQLWIFADEQRKEYLETNYKTLDYINNMKFYY